MAKKLNAKERREQEQKEKLEKIRKQEADRRAAEEMARLKKEQEEAERRAQELARREKEEADRIEKQEKEELERLIKEKPELLRHKKSIAKAAGLKSTFVIGDNLLMTSFGKGNDAIIEHEVNDFGIVSRDNPAFSVEATGPVFQINGRNALRAITDDPRHQQDKQDVGEDLIGAKAALEKRFFDCNFNDNIHIQLIYNILDMEKILAKHINNIVYAMDNIRGIKEHEYDDFMGYMSLKNGYNVFTNPDQYRNDDREKEIKVRNTLVKQKAIFDEMLKNPRIAYFGSAFYNTGMDVKARKEKMGMRDAEQIYYMLGLLGDARQSLAHSSNTSRDFLYTLHNARRQAITALDKLYAERVNALNADFIKHSGKDITIIFNTLDTTSLEEKERIVKDYYDFVVRKSYKNLGFSIKKLRERLMDKFFECQGFGADDKDFSSIRQKFYKILDFVIFQYYREREDRIALNVEALRACLTDADKEICYAKEANLLWKEMRSKIVEEIYPQMDGKKISSLKPDSDISADMIKSVLIDGRNVDYFSKMIYMLTLFIDGKEINDLLTTLIHKFENIASYLSVLEKKGMHTRFVPNYAMFSRSEKIAGELREINSFARMQKPNPSAKKQMFLDAATILGTNDSQKELEEYFDKVLDKKQGKMNGKKDNTFRNFIASNVIESDRFIYIVRYNNTQNIRRLAKNRNVITFVLNQIPDAQIQRYCKTCGIGILASHKEQIETLANKIAEMDFSNFKDVPSAERARKSKQDGESRNTMQGMIGLYLTVLYLLTKNLVNVNSRYFLAFHCLERDAQLLGSMAGYQNKEKKISCPYKDLTEQLLRETKSNGKPRLNRHASSYLRTNIANSDDWVIRQFRKNVMHLGAIRNAHQYIDGIKSIRSYFELYHYLNQRHLATTYDHAIENHWENVTTYEKTLFYFKTISESSWYCKDFVKAYCVGFGYNLPRYKNLTIDALFDMNNPPLQEDSSDYRCRNLVK